MTSGHPRLELSNLSKTFGVNRVLSGVDLTVNSGEIVGLAGQNGSGKSTLIKILTGVHSPDAGARIVIDGTPLRLPVQWRDAHALGVSVVHQDLGLLDHLTVAENVCVGGYPTAKLGRIDHRARDHVTEVALARIGSAVSPRTLVGGLSAVQRAEVAIARALRDHAPGRGLVILDESTRAMRGTDLDRAHALVRRIVENGSSVLLISHSLPELAALTHRVTVLRDGAVAGEFAAYRGDLTEASIARAMLGGSLGAFKRQSGVNGVRRSEQPRVTVTGLGGKRTRDLSFSIERGEIVGITGLPASGYEEIPGLLTGASRAVSGALTVDGQALDLTRTSVIKALRAGVILIPERRHRDGLALEMSVRDNITLPRLRHRPSTFLSRKWQTRQADQAIREHDVRPANPNTLLRELSGGNQQKVLLAKWLAMNPSLLVLHEPTQAVDVGARAEILAKISAAADGGASVLVVSSEADDLVTVCDRVLVYTAAGLVPGNFTDVADLLERVLEPDARRAS